MRKYRRWPDRWTYNVRRFNTTRQYMWFGTPRVEVQLAQKLSPALAQQFREMGLEVWRGVR